jgi:hypothetical protein
MTEPLSAGDTEVQTFCIFRIAVSTDNFLLHPLAAI